MFKKFFEILGTFFLSATIYQMMINWLASEGYLTIDEDGLQLK